MGQDGEWKIWPGELYRHYEGKLYQIVAVASHWETGEAMVVYQELFGRFRILVQPYSQFTREVDQEMYPKAGQRYLYKRVCAEDGSGTRMKKPIETEKIKTEGIETKKTETERLEAKKTEPESMEPERARPISTEPESTRSERIKPERTGTKEGSGDKAEKAAQPGMQLEKVQETGAEKTVQPELQPERKSEAGEHGPNPELMRFLAAETLEEKIACLNGLAETASQSDIESIYMVLDMKPQSGSIQEQISAIRGTLAIQRHYEGVRLR